jgi:predicted Zn-dependent protease
MKKTIFRNIIFFTFCIAGYSNTPLPEGMPEYFELILENKDKKFVLLKKEMEDSWHHHLYLSRNSGETISIEKFLATRTQAPSLWHNLTLHLSEKIKKDNGIFLELNENCLEAEMHKEKFNVKYYGFILPDSIVLFTYTLKDDTNPDLCSNFNLLEGLINRWRYEEAVKSGNVAMGQWGFAVHRYALNTLKTDKQKAAEIYKNLLETSPFFYEAHLEFASLNDHENAKKNYKIIVSNSENETIVNEALKALKVEWNPLSSHPILGSEETPYHLVLIPLEPCNPHILSDAAEKFKLITGIPVSIQRLKEKWEPGEPQRFFNRLSIEQFLASKLDVKVNLSEWEKEDFLEKLDELSQKEDPISKYYTTLAIKYINENKGQYDATKLILNLHEAVNKIDPKDNKTLYVGITETDLFSKENNFIFSYHINWQGTQLSLLSYNRMLAKNTGEAFESKDRLTERIAKELVPASLKSLGIPRSKNPACPYSYSSGVERLDQKTMKLSEHVAEALEYWKQGSKSPLTR